MPSSRRYLVADDADLDALLAGLVGRLDLVRHRPRTERRTLLDTFDWRVWRDGGVLALERTGRRGGTLTWRDLGTGSVRGRLEVRRTPRTADDLPDGPVADRLAQVLDIRALTPLATLTGTTTELGLTDDEDKTVARLVVEQAVVEGGGPLPTTVELRPVRGYRRQAARLAEVLDAQLVLTPDDDGIEARALAAAGHTPGGYSSKLRLALDPDATAGEALVEVLRTLRTTMAENEAGTRADLDSEFLHDLRVAIRRTRSVLAQARGVLDPEALVRWKDEFRWLGAVTTPTRDLDVWLLTLPELAEGIDEALRPELAPLAERLAAEQRRSQRAMVRQLDSSRCRRLLADYDAWLADPGTARGAGAATPDAGRPAREVCGARIAKAFRRVERDGRRIHDDTPAEALHTLRKDAKKLRYALELYGSLFPSDDVAPLVKDLKSLQDVLGEFQDGEVQTTSLRGLADALVADGAGAGVVLAMGALVEHLAERQATARAAFAERFAAFDTGRNRRRARRIADGTPRPAHQPRREAS